jgi:3-hydroxy-3-methylglutaryl CoA synthase
MGLVESAPVRAGHRVAIFAYGSGSCAEYQSGTLLPEARAAVDEAALGKALDARRGCTVAEYEAIECERNANVMSSDYVPNYNSCGDWYSDRYEGNGLLVLDKIERYYRHYRWS